MGKYLQLIDRAALERRRDKSDQSDKSSPTSDEAPQFGRLYRFGRGPDPSGSSAGGAPHAWAKALARLDPSKPPDDVPPKRWLRFIEDCGKFLDAGWAARAAVLGWGPIDLFGCDRKRPFARIDNMGLLWFLNGGTIIALQRDGAVIETRMAARQSYRRRSVDMDRAVLAWELEKPALTI